MPVRGSYNVSSAGEAAEKVPGSSPREKYWMFKLITFIVLCIVIVALCLIWSESSDGGIKDRSETAKQVSSPSEHIPGVSNSSGNDTKKSQLNRTGTAVLQLDNTTQTLAQNHSFEDTNPDQKEEDESTTEKATYSTETTPSLDSDYTNKTHPIGVGKELPETPKGRQLASEMIFYLNHSAEPCEDFYEYACGNFESNRAVAGNDLQEDAIRRIFDEAERQRESPKLAPFIKYYENCISHEKKPNDEKINLAKKAIDEFGKFYTTSDKLDNFDFTEMLSKLLFSDNAPLFDITLDVAAMNNPSCDDSSSPATFTLKVGPSDLDNSFFMQKQAQDCYNQQKLLTKREEINLEHHYQEYNSCKDTIIVKYLDSVVEALTKLKFGNEDEIGNVKFHLEKQILNPFYGLAVLPDRMNDVPSQEYKDKQKIRTAYAERNYDLMRIDRLQEQINVTFLNWTRLIGYQGDKEIQVYFRDVVLNGLKLLSIDTDPKLANNALLAIYAHKVYQELVVEHSDVEKYCEQLTTSLMQPHASMLYMSSFARKDLEAMNTMVTEMFTELKSTFESGLMNAAWQKNASNSNVMKKFHTLSIALPQNSSYLDNWSVMLTDDHINNTMMLHKNYRTSMYQLLRISEIKSEQIWTYFALPYQATSLAIHGLNKVVVPYAAIHWPTVWSAKNTSSEHIITATVGTLIAQEIAHHFDPTGIKFLDGKKSPYDNQPILFCKEAHSVLEEYKKTVTNGSDTSGDINLPTTAQNVQYKIPPLSMNSRVADAIGLQLAYDTMRRLSSTSKNKLLPWLSDQATDENKQFFLAYAQSHCSKIPLTSSFVSLFEDENLPSRLRILFAASNNNFLGSTWKCPIGSKVHPVEDPSVFPKLPAVSGNNSSIIATPGPS